MSLEEERVVSWMKSLVNGLEEELFCSCRRVGWYPWDLLCPLEEDLVLCPEEEPVCV